MISFFAAALYLQAPAAAQPAPPPQTVSAPAPAAERRSTAMHMDGGARPAIYVDVNGEGPFAFAVDTAAQSHVVMPRLVERLSLQPADAQASVQGASGREAARLYALASYSSEVFDYRNAPAVGLPNAGATEAWGLVGMAHFTSKRIEFDNREMLFSVMETTPPPADYHAVPTTFIARTFAIVEVVIDGVPIKAVIDSGAGRTVASPEVLAALGWRSDDSRLTQDRPIVGATEHGASATRAKLDVHLGPAVFQGAEISFADLPVFDALGLGGQPAIILGSNVLRQLSGYAIDYPRGEFQLRL